MTCRTRKLKCDELKPICSPCRKASRECRPSEGIVFRHQQNASMNKGGEAVGQRGNLKGFYSYKNTFDEDSVWLEVPKQGMLCVQEWFRPRMSAMARPSVLETRLTVIHFLSDFREHLRPFCRRSRERIQLTRTAGGRDTGRVENAGSLPVPVRREPCPRFGGSFSCRIRRPFLLPSSSSS